MRMLVLLTMETLQVLWNFLRLLKLEGSDGGRHLKKDTSTYLPHLMMSGFYKRCAHLPGQICSLDLEWDS